MREWLEMIEDIAAVHAQLAAGVELHSGPA
jgi:hypothetical protein